MPKVYTWIEFLIPGNEDVDRRTLRKYFDEYREEKGIPEQCAIPACHFHTQPLVWNGMPLRLELDHENGNSLDNSPPNLRLLCPNCHSQQGTDKGSNKGRVELLADEGETPTGRSYVLQERNGTKHFKYYPTGFVALPTLRCPACQNDLVSRDFIPNKRGGAPNASTFDSCMRRCNVCGIGFSNARNPDDVVCIYRAPDDAIPTEVRGTLDGVLQQSMNVLNRASKYVKFCSESSEDAVTWTVFLGLQRAGRLREILSKLGCGISQAVDAEPVMLLWGVPIPSDSQNGVAVRDRLVAIADAIGERANSRSEPDVILDFGDAGVVFIEVKHRSANELKDATYGGWKKYLQQSPAFLDADEVRKTGMYELARNWRFVWDLAEQRPLWLVNLGPAELSNDPHLADFGKQLNQDARRQFQFISWQQFVNEIGADPDWLLEFLNSRGVA